MIEPGRIGGRVCHSCKQYMTHDQPAVLVGVVFSGMEKSMLIVLCAACMSNRLGNCACANVGRRDLAAFFDTLAKDGEVHVNG